MPLLSGLFGASQLILSLSGSFEIPPPLPFSKNPDYFSLIKNTIWGTFAGSVVAWIPGISSSIATVLSVFIPREIQKAGYFFGLCQKQEQGNESDMSEDSAKKYIIRISAINTSNTIFGLVAFFLIYKSRNGAVVSINRLFMNADPPLIISEVDTVGRLSIFLLFFVAILICGFLSFFSTIEIGQNMVHFIQKINYRVFSAVTLVFLTVLIFSVTGLYGFLIFFISTLVGFLPIFLKVRKSTLMGVILVPVTIYFSHIHFYLFSFFQFIRFYIFQ